MNFEKAMKNIITGFEKNGINYALIGWFAVGLYEITRTTIDLDFIVDYKDKEKYGREKK